MRPGDNEIVSTKTKISNQVPQNKGGIQVRNLDQLPVVNLAVETLKSLLYFDTLLLAHVVLTNLAMSFTFSDFAFNEL